jgi:hypothetical protein
LHVVVFAVVEPLGQVGAGVHQPAGLLEREVVVVAGADDAQGVLAAVSGVLLDGGLHLRIPGEIERLHVM